MTAKKKKAKDLQADLMGSAHKVWLAGLGAMAVAEDEGSKLFKNLVERGKDIESVGKEHVEKARGTVTGVKTVAESYWETFEHTLDDQFTAVIHRLGVPTKGEIEALTKKVEDLTGSIEKLRAKPASPRTRTTKSTASRAKTTKATTAKK